MIPNNPRYQDKHYIPVPQYKVGQRVFVLEDSISRSSIAEKLIRAVNKPYWYEGNEHSTSCWVITYRYQDIIGGTPFGRMHTEYVLYEENIYPTEELATIALANNFVEETKRTAMEIAKRFKSLGIPLGGDTKRLLLPISKIKEEKK